MSSNLLSFNREAELTTRGKEWRAKLARVEDSLQEEVQRLQAEVSTIGRVTGRTINTTTGWTVRKFYGRTTVRDREKFKMRSTG